MTKPSLWIPRRLSDATMARALRDYHVITNPGDAMGFRALDNLDSFLQAKSLMTFVDANIGHVFPRRISNEIL